MTNEKTNPMPYRAADAAAMLAAADAAEAAGPDNVPPAPSITTFTGRSIGNLITTPPKETLESYVSFPPSQGQVCGR